MYINWDNSSEAASDNNATLFLYTCKYFTHHTSHTNTPLPLNFVENHTQSCRPVHISAMLLGCLDLCRNVLGSVLYASEWPSSRSSSLLSSLLMAYYTSHGLSLTLVPSEIPPTSQPQHLAFHVPSNNNNNNNNNNSSSSNNNTTW